MYMYMYWIDEGMLWLLSIHLGGWHTSSCLVMCIMHTELPLTSLAYVYVCIYIYDMYVNYVMCIIYIMCIA